MSTSKTQIVAAGIVGIVISSGCASDPAEGPELDVEARFNPTLDVSAYQYFGIVDPLELVFEPPPPGYDELNPSVLGAMERELTDLGLIRARPPQLVANPRIYFINADGEPDTYGAYWGYDETWLVPPPTYEAGTLVVDVVDVQGTVDDETDDVLAFKGIASGFRGESTETIQLLVYRACEEMFSAWPIP